MKKGWRKVKFGEVVRLVSDRCADPVGAGIERYVGLEHLEPGDLRIRTWGNVADGTTFTNRFRPGQVLFGKRRAYQKKLAVADFEGVCSGDIYVFESKDPTKLLPELLAFICQTDAFFTHAVGTSAGSLSPRTNWSSLADFEFALPPVEEQRRLVTKHKATQLALEVIDQAIESAEKLRRSYLIETFRPRRGRHDEFPCGWTTEAADKLGDVQLGQQRHPKYEVGDNVRPYLRVANVLDGKIDFGDVLSMHFPEESLAKFELAPGDILLNEGQSTELVGRSAIYRGELPGACFQKTLLRFRCGPRLLPEFVHAFFQHALYTGQFAAMCAQTTSMAHLTAVRFARMNLPVPPMEEQQRITARKFELERVIEMLSARRSEAKKLISASAASTMEA